MRQAALATVHELARRDPRVVFVGSDLGPGTLDAMRREMPERFFMEGISEQAVIGLAAGLALDGFVPYVNTIAPFFTRRALEQIAIDLCLHKLPVRLLGNGGGMVYAPLGPTHMAIEDVAVLRALPGMSVVAPADAEEMRALVRDSLDRPGPIYFRIAKGGDPEITPDGAERKIGRAELLRPGQDVLLIGTGIMTYKLLRVAHELAARGIHCAVLHVATVKPLDGRFIRQAAHGCQLIVVAEEHVRQGGLYGAIAEMMMELGPLKPILPISLPDAFPEGYGSQEHLLANAGLTVDAMTERIAARWNRLETPL